MSNIYVTTQLKNRWRDKIKSINARMRLTYERNSLTSARLTEVPPPPEDFLTIATALVPHLLMANPNTGYRPSTLELGMTLAPHMSLMGVHPLHLAPYAYLAGADAIVDEDRSRHLRAALNFGAWVWEREFPIPVTHEQRECMGDMAMYRVHPVTHIGEVHFGAGGSSNYGFRFHTIPFDRENPSALIPPMERRRCITAHAATTQIMWEGFLPAPYNPILRPATDLEIDSVFEAIPDGTMFRTVDIHADSYFESVDCYRLYRDTMSTLPEEAVPSAPPTPSAPTPTTGRIARASARAGRDPAPSRAVQAARDAMAAVRGGSPAANRDRAFFRSSLMDTSPPIEYDVVSASPPATPVEMPTPATPEATYGMNVPTTAVEFVASARRAAAASYAAQEASQIETLNDLIDTDGN